MSVEVETIVTGPFVENAYLVYDPQTHDAVIIDPGDDPGRITRTVEQVQAKPLAVLLTHAHIDHVGAVGAIVEKYGIPLLCHRDEQRLLDGLVSQARMFGLQATPAPKPSRYVDEGETLTFGSLSFQVLHTPGHTRGGVCYLTGKRLFVGDTLFAGSIGRTDLPGGNYDAIIRSIQEKILPLGDDVTVYSGHGPETTVAREKRSNPFLN